jgi:hypothetical protein
VVEDFRWMDGGKNRSTRKTASIRNPEVKEKMHAYFVYIFLELL